VRNPFVRRHPFGEEELSSYLDRRLSPAESTRLEEHLASCEPCRRHLEGLRAVVEGLRALPSAPAPRSFALRPEQVEAPRRRTPVGPAAWAQRASAFGPAGAAAAALLLFLVLVGVDLATLGGGGGPESVPAPSAKEAFEAGQALSAAPAPTLAPAPAARAADEEGNGAGTPEPTTEAPTPTEAPATLAPPGTAGEGGDAGRWVLRGFQGAAGAAFLAAMAALVWQRRPRRGADHG
jgi:anti-sigma factor RsiW